jgi:hypothetical protein
VAAREKASWSGTVGWSRSWWSRLPCVAGPGESVDVPQGAKHRLSNEGKQELVIVEVQHGAYTGEDDICRHDDDYGRHATDDGVARDEQPTLPQG